MIRFAVKMYTSSIFDGFVACLAAPLVLWGPECLPACAALWPVPPDYNRLAGWLQLAGCCWLAAGMKEVPHARRSRMSADCGKEDMSLETLPNDSLDFVRDIRECARIKGLTPLDIPLETTLSFIVILAL